MKASRQGVSRRGFLQGTAAGVAAATIVPRNVLGRGEIAPSEELGGALIGCGVRGQRTFEGLGPGVRMLAQCDVRFRGKEDNQTIYTDFRRVLERTDIDVVAVATPPGWHAPISIAAMEAGKDVLCEKPMARCVAEGRAIAEAEKRFGRIFQIGTYGRFKADQSIRKIFDSGLLKACDTVVIRRGGFKVKRWSGQVAYSVESIPNWLDWDMYCGPSPLRPYHEHRFGMTHRGYWDYEGGGLSDMAHHHLDGQAYQYGRDRTAPIEITPMAPIAHPEACGLWGWCELKYADGFTLVLDSGEWGDPYDRLSERNTSEADLLRMLSDDDRQKLDALPTPAPLLNFTEAVKTRQPAGGNAEAARRVAMIYHLANVAFRTGRTLHFDPVTEEIVGDDPANRLVNLPTRAPWRI